MVEARISLARNRSEYEDARRLFEEYAASLDFDLCFQNFEEELTALENMYGPPRGGILLARRAADIIGCVAFRPLRDQVCEMKRLYVRPEARRSRLGSRLATEVLDQARAAGYRRMVLDTVESMEPARRLYRSLGFRETEPYYRNPIDGVIYMELDLTR